MINPLKKDSIELTKDHISRKIESYILTHNSSYIDAIVSICETHDIEYIIISKLLSKPILEKITEEGRGLNLLTKSKNKLPFK